MFNLFFRFVGVNASDINKAKGRYFGTPKVPFGIGFEVRGKTINKILITITFLKLIFENF